MSLPSQGDLHCLTSLSYPLQNAYFRTVGRHDNIHRSVANHISVVQTVPSNLIEQIGDPDPSTVGRVWTIQLFSPQQLQDAAMVYPAILSLFTLLVIREAAYWW